MALCFIYVTAGYVGRDPLRTEDATTYIIATQWLSVGAGWPVTGMHVSDILGAWSIRIFSALSAGLIPAALSVRLPFALMLTLSLICTWEATYYLARQEAAQPLAFAFGGEAKPTAYARTVADAALLALLASLGLARIGHETSPALWQLLMVCLLYFALCVHHYHPKRALVAGVISLGGLFLNFYLMRAGTVLAAPSSLSQKILFLKNLLIWYAWPAWLFALLALYRWRRFWLTGRPAAHIALPAFFVVVHLLVAIGVNPAERWLISLLPPLATLAAFALPTIGRSFKSLVDFLSIVCFTGGALVIWVVWISLQTGYPPQPAANVARLQPGYIHTFSMPLFLFAAAITLVWGRLLRWRLGRHQAAIWMSMVLPAGGWVLCWTLMMTLWLPLLNHARKALLP